MQPKGSGLASTLNGAYLATRGRHSIDPLRVICSELIFPKAIRQRSRSSIRFRGPRLEKRISKSELNPLTELAELRLSMNRGTSTYDVGCQLRFSSAELEFRNRDYLVGISEARLQLYLEGLETVLGEDFGDADLPTTEATRESTSETDLSVGLAFEADVNGPNKSGIATGMGASRRRSQTLRSTSALLPMVALPNAAWRVRNVEGAGQDATLDGTAMRGQRLCRLQAKSGGNRTIVTAELQVRRSHLRVKPASGDKWGKRFSLIRNKDAVVGLVLQRAIRREAAAATGRELQKTVVVSKVEMLEE